MLGRHVQHDPRSRDYPFTADLPVKSVRWLRRSPILDQGDLGSCTGNAAAGWLATDSLHRVGRSDITEQVAVTIYSRATHLDRVRGVYPPDDTGSSGLAAAKAMVRLGLTAGTYRHCFSVEAALKALQLGPVLVGLTWLTSCDTPDHTGLIRWTGEVRGGHEVLADEVNLEQQRIGFTNSWSDRWGLHGRFYLSLEDFTAALHDHGDVTVPS